MKDLIFVNLSIASFDCFQLSWLSYIHIALLCLQDPFMVIVADSRGEGNQHKQLLVTV